MTEIKIANVAVIFFAAILTNNIILTNFLGLCSFYSLSNNLKTAFYMGISVASVTFVSSIINFGIYKLVLIEDAPFVEADLTYLTYFIFIVLIAGLVQLVELAFKKYLPGMIEKFGIFLALITVNCAIMGVNLFMIEPVRGFNIIQAGAYSLGSGLGWLLVICVFAAIRNRLEDSKIPVSLRGMGINLLTTGIMTMIFMGFAGMIDL